MPHYLGIEIGGTKLQLGIGRGDGALAALWRGRVDVAAGPEGIRRQIAMAVPELLERAKVDRRELEAVGIGFGGPVDDGTETIIKSHQIEGWDGFPLADWMHEIVGLPAVLANDADVAGLAEALFGAGKGWSPIFYITIGSGIGGGLIIDGQIYRGAGRGAAEIGHLALLPEPGSGDPLLRPLEEYASGWSIARNAVRALERAPAGSRLAAFCEEPERLSTDEVAKAALEGDELAAAVFCEARSYLARAICHVIALLCPRRIIIGGGVSLIGEELLFKPLRQLVAEQVFRPFAGCYEIVPAALGEEVVVHGAVALAKRRFG
jgi:glucokinase